MLAGDSEIPVVYEVERVRDGKSFVTRTVQARQRGRCIFTTTISFMKEGSGGWVRVEHQSAMPRDVEVPPEGRGRGGLEDAAIGGDDGTTPFESVRCRIFQGSGGKPEEKRTRQWIRARGRISDGGEVGTGGGGLDQRNGAVAPLKGDNHQAHLSALAYMSDSYFIGTVARVHNLLRFSLRSTIEPRLGNVQGSDKEREEMRAHMERIAREEEEENAAYEAHQASGRPQKQVGMMVSLDHSIYFHNPKKFRADEWMLTEMNSPWAGEGRGLVLQRIWSKDGVLIATCTQEGLVRLKQEKESKI